MDVPLRDPGSLVSSKVEGALAQVEALLSNHKRNLRFPDLIENEFLKQRSAACIKHITISVIFGVIFYNSFLFTDYFLMYDIINLIIVVQICIVTPVILLFLLLIRKKLVSPEFGVTLCLLIVVGTILMFYMMSASIHAQFLIFTIPVCLAFGNVLLPLPFKQSIWFTGLCVLVSSVTVFSRLDWNPALSAFSILINANAGAYMLIGTYRMEVNDRRAYLFNLREKLRADALVERNVLLQNLSETDALTGVANRRYFDAAFQRLFEAAVQGATPLSLLLIDIDHFKRVNDSYGHKAGDLVLRSVARCLEQHSLPDSVVARYGGEEFAVLLPGITGLYARSCAEVLRSAVERLTAAVSKDGLPKAVTVSIGGATLLPESGAPGLDLMEAADRALYRAKADGRNRVEGWPRSTAIADASATAEIRSRPALHNAAG